MNSIDANLIKNGTIGDEIVVNNYDLDATPAISVDIANIIQKALEAGKRGEEVRFYIGGRKFAIRKLAQ